MNPGDIKAGGAYVEISADTSLLEKALAAVGDKLKGFGDSFLGVSAKIAGAGAAMQAPFINALHSFAQTGSQFKDISDRTGIAVETLSQYGYILKQSGGSVNDFVAATRGLSRIMASAGEDGKRASAAFAKLGVDAVALKNMTPAQQFETMVTALQGVKNESERTALTMQIFGRAGMSLQPIVRMTAEELDKMKKRGQEVGAVWSGDMAGKADDLGDLYEDMKFKIQDLNNAIATALLPTATRIINSIIEWIGKAREWIAQNAQLVDTAFKVSLAIAKIGAALLALASAAKVIAFLASPWALVVAGVLAVLEALGVLDLGIASTAKAMGLGTEAIHAFFLTLWKNLVVGWERVKNGAIDAWEAMKLSGRAAAEWMLQAMLSVGQKIASGWWTIVGEIGKAIDWMAEKINVALAALGMEELETGGGGIEAAAKRSARFYEDEMKASQDRLSTASEDYQSGREARDKETAEKVRAIEKDTFDAMVADRLAAMQEEIGKETKLKEESAKAGTAAGAGGGIGAGLPAMSAGPGLATREAFGQFGAAGFAEKFYGLITGTSKDDKMLAQSQKQTKLQERMAKALEEEDPAAVFG